MAKDFAQEVAARLREVRMAQGLSVRELARRADVLPEVISRSERGVTEITLTTLAKVCTALDMAVPEFFSFSRVEKKRMAPSIQRLVRLLSMLPGSRVETIARGLALLLRGVAASGDSRRRR